MSGLSHNPVSIEFDVGTILFRGWQRGKELSRNYSERPFVLFLKMGEHNKQHQRSSLATAISHREGTS